jgi:spermidine synthase
MKKRYLLIYICFFFSGAAGLVYAVVWARQLGLFLGITAHANTAVITAYMLGLAWGSWWIGRRSDCWLQPLRCYAWLEIGVGVFAATSPWLFSVLQSGYVGAAGETGIAGPAAYLVRFTIACLALLVPAFLMGGTLPLLVRGVLREAPQLGAVTGCLYGINTLGAMLGTAITGFVLLPRFGVNNSIMTGVATNIGIALLVLVLLPGLSQASQEPAEPKPNPKTKTKTASKAQLKIQAKVQARSLAKSQANTLAKIAPSVIAVNQAMAVSLTATQRTVLLSGCCVAGFAALLTQLAWIRAMVLVIGGSVYAFTLTLTSFLAGIGIGSLVYSAWLSRKAATVDQRFQLAGILALLIGFSTLFSLLLIARLPAWFLGGYEAGWVQEFAVYPMFISALCAAVMFLPTLLMGALLPLLAVSWTATDSVGRGIGSAYAVNTIGAIVGCLLGGLVLLPWLGIHYGIMLSAGLYCAIAAAFWLVAKAPRRLVPAFALVLFIAATWLIPEWNREQMTSGVFYRPELRISAIRSIGLDELLQQNRLVYYQEGANGTVSVTDDGSQKSLHINGKVEASSRNDLPTQINLAQIGALLHPDPRDALVIGLSSGVTAGSLTTHDSISGITVLEISPEVVEAADLFAADNHDVLHHPKIDIVVADARNYVIATDRQWDLIVSGPGDPWVSGVSNLFTEDFFRLVKTKLAPGGILIQGLHLYGLTVDEVKTVLKGFSKTFRHVTVWQLQTGDLVITGSDHLQSFDMLRLQQSFGHPLTGPELLRAGFSAPRDFLLHFLISDDPLQRYTSGAEPNTDERPRIEFNAPVSMYARRSTPILQDIVEATRYDRFRLPLQNELTRTPSLLRNNAMELEVSSNPDADFENLQSNWWLWRVLQPTESGTSVAVADFREMYWNEKDGQIRVQLVRDRYAPDAAQRNNYLAAFLTLPRMAGGDLGRAGDPDAIWLMGATPESDRVEMGLFWVCSQADGGSNWMIVSYRLPGASVQDPFTLASTFGDRFRCN